MTCRFADLSNHTVSATVPVAAEVAFSFVADAGKVDTWTLGSMNAEPAGSEGVYKGRSIYDGGSTFFKAAPDPERNVVDYLVGADAANLVKRISVRIDRGAEDGGQRCTVTLSADRADDMDDARWHRLCAFHEVEILLLEARLRALA